jgi:flavorubredoxin
MTTLNTPQELVDGIHWLGMRRNIRLETNTYLALFQEKRRSLPLLVDPGGPYVLRAILKRLEATLGDIRQLRMIFLSHHDADAAINIASLLKRNPALVVFCTDDVWRLAYILGISAARFQPVQTLKNGTIRLPWGQELKFLPIPFCPSRGACMMYDQQSRVLFSGALFGGITFTPALFATPQHWEGIRMWHQMYISTKEALQRAIDLVRELDPPPRFIAPQHGAVLKDDIIPLILERLSTLPVGLELHQVTAIDKLMYLEAINDVLGKIRQKAGNKVVEYLLHRLDEDRSFPHLFSIKDGKLVDIQDDILDDVMGSFKMFMYALIQDQPSKIQELIKTALLESNWDLSTFMESFIHREITE